MNPASSKAKVVPRPEIPDEPLLLSALRWVGGPVSWTRDGNVDAEEYGRYVNAITPSTPLSRVGWSEDLDAFVYRIAPGKPQSFVYERESTVVSYSSDYGLRGDANRQNPMFLVHRPLPSSVGSAFAFKKRSDHNSKTKRTTVTPFIFATFRIHCMRPSVPNQSLILRLLMPDLELHRGAVEDKIGHTSDDEGETRQTSNLNNHGANDEGKGDTDSFWSPRSDNSRYLDSVYLGPWHGSWVRKFIRDAVSGKPLEPLEKIVWDSDVNPAVGIKTKLEPIGSSVEWEWEGHIAGWKTRLGKRRLQSYKIRATVMEIYITPKFFEAIPEVAQTQEAPRDEDSDGGELEDDEFDEHDEGDDNFNDHGYERQESEGSDWEDESAYSQRSAWEGEDSDRYSSGYAD
ncbi:hypothetical protein DENSPDRAFT_847758 [Dentipellis sp. KUC8613]|nr:hypothetical protein DENSPDRAFT_847758 [Dentipellis sp. KUC8613]